MVIPSTTSSREAASPRAWERVLRHVESSLLDGTLTPGDHLPPERELAASLGVGRSSVREALRVLEVLGLIRTGTGSGPTSGAIIVAAPQGGMAALLRLQVAANGFPLEDVMRTRLVLEEAVVTQLAGHDDRSTAAASTIATAMEEPTLTAAEFLALDAQLHQSLAEASGNVVIAAMMAGLRTSIESYVQAGAARIPEWEPVAARLRGEHRALLDAIDDGHVTLARTLIHDHITGYYAEATPARLPA
ncbi:FadR/GntR family transcriptional regulator [Microbacterium sp. P01]|uniref:FadR/GntR family transcriptional regulator n=1 Tax=unclassified Microbacterium TaxID=2609290 RepID=UPI0036716825